MSLHNIIWRHCRLHRTVSLRTTLPASDGKGCLSMVQRHLVSPPKTFSLPLVRAFHGTSKPDGTGKETVMVRVLEQGKALPHQQWIIRMNNQNGYLSWCRNSYLCLSLAIAISMAPIFLAQQNSNSSGELGEELTYVVGGAGALAMCNMVFGSVEFIYQLWKTRPLTQMALFTLVIYTTAVAVHALLFCDMTRSLIKCFDVEDS